MKRRKTKRFNIFKIFSVIIIIIFISFVPTLIQKLIKINIIECKSQYGTCPQDIETELKNFELRDYKLAKKEISKILSGNYLIHDFSLLYQIPSKVLVEINLKKSKYAIMDSGKNIYYLVDQNGLVLEISHESNLPAIIENRVDINIGETISEKQKFALDVVEKMAWLYSVKTGVIDNDELSVALKEGVLIRFPLEGEADALVGGLRLIFSRLNDGSQGIRMEDIKEIDLRFKNPVLR